MAIGELEYKETFQKGETPFHGTTIVLFLMLLVVMLVVLMNMLIGLAANDINEIQNEAEMEIMSSLIKMVLEYERPLFDKCMRKKRQEKYKKILKIDNKCSESMLHKWFSMIMVKKTMLSRENIFSKYSSRQDQILTSIGNPSIASNNQKY